MPKIGLSKPYVAVVSESGSTVTYTKRFLLGKYTELSIEPDSADANIFYADNAESESDTAFTGGTATVTTDDLLPTVYTDVLGVVEESAAQTPSTDKWYVFNDSQNAPYLALGGVIMVKNGGDVKYQAFILEKIKFANPGLAVTTKGETVEWQTTELTATIFKSAKTGHPWYRLSSLVASEAAAAALIENYLTVEEPEPEPEGE